MDLLDPIAPAPQKQYVYDLSGSRPNVASTNQDVDFFNGALDSTPRNELAPTATFNLPYHIKEPPPPPPYPPSVTNEQVQGPIAIPTSHHHITDPPPPPPPSLMNDIKKTPVVDSNPDTFASRKTSTSKSFGHTNSSNVSAYSSASRYSQYSTTTSANLSAGATILNDKTFAPPPALEKSFAVTKNEYMGTQKVIKSTLPSHGSVKHSGDCLARFSIKSLLIKKWRKTFWITYGNNQILFFRSREDYEDWVSNPYLEKDDRNKLVKLNIDFKNDRYAKTVKGYTITRIATKYYLSKVMHTFKVERWHSYGPAVAVAIGGKDFDQVQNLRTIVAAMLDVHPQGNLKAVDDSDMSSYYGSSRSSGSSIASSSFQSFGSKNKSSSQTQSLASIKEEKPKSKKNKEKKEISNENSYYAWKEGNAPVDIQKPIHKYDLGVEPSKKEKKKKRFLGIFRKKKKAEEPEPEIQYYVGRPSHEANFQYNASAMY